MALLEIKNLSFKYNNSDELVLDDINLKIDEGDFVLLSGESGCGKTTLLRLIKKELSPSGSISGSILYQNKDITTLDERTLVTDFGYVMQNPDNQIVTDKVWHELAFGLENLGEVSDIIRRRVAEISSFFGINKWYNKNTSELSGGEKQLLNLASVMVMEPKLLLLDEAISQLDPISSREFLFNLKKINEELGITIIIVDHKLDEIFPLVNKVVVMDKTKIHMIDSPRNVAMKLSDSHRMSKSLPASVKIYKAFEKEGVCPLTVNEARNYLRNNFNNDYQEVKVFSEKYDEVAIEISNAYFRYNRDTVDVLKNLNLKIFKNEIISIVGGNGVGKTTLLKVLSGLNKIYSGKIKIWGKNINKYSEASLYRNNIAMLPQNPVYLFTENSCYDELFEVNKLSNEYNDLNTIEEVSNELNIKHLWKNHPYDLSGGESQRLALAKLLLMNPKILLLDEPTKGLDFASKEELAKILLKLKEEGKTIVIVTHDIEFASKYSTRCAMYFDGEIASIDNNVDFFAKNNYYTTCASRITRSLFKNAITTEKTIELCLKNGKKKV